MDSRLVKLGVGSRGVGYRVLNVVNYDLYSFALVAEPLARSQ